MWRNNPLLDFGLCVSETTGELRTQRREAQTRSMRFVLTPTRGNAFSCSLYGSLHKYKNGDDTNHNAFTFRELSETLDRLARDYGLDLLTTIIHSLEIGVNIPLDYKPEIILKNVICHKGKPFDSLDYRKRKLGLICVHTDYTIKLYDKGHQGKIEELDKYVLRYEVKAHRQRVLEPFGIRTLADLKDIEKVTALIRLLWERLDEIVFFDYSFKSAGLSESKRLNWERYSNPNYWANLNRRDYYKARKRYAELLSKYNCIDWQKFVSKHTTKIWFELSGIKHKKGRRFPQYLEGLESSKKGTFSKLEYVMEDVAPGDVGKRKEKQPVKSPRYCISCGRQITGQKSGSLFCSEKLYGKQARQCRNKDSNRRLAIKRKINRAMNDNLMLHITYRDKDGNTYTDILGAKEISVTREWLDRVLSVERLEPQPSTLKDKEAQDYLQTISNTNNNETTH